jgi:hypothetical protein
MDPPRPQLRLDLGERPPPQLTHVVQAGVLPLADASTPSGLIA